MRLFGAFGENVLQWWTLTRHGHPVDPQAPRDPSRVELRDPNGRYLGIAAIRDDDRSYDEQVNAIDLMRAEPLDRPPTWRELDAIRDAQREAGRQLPQPTPHGFLRGDHDDSLVLSATPPVERERF